MTVDIINDPLDFAEMLADCRIIDECAVGDADGYDGGITLGRVIEAHRRLREAISKEVANIKHQRDRLADAIKRHKEALHPCTSEKADTELWKALAAVEGGAP